MSKQVSLSDLKHFYGELKDGTEGQNKFRDFVTNEKWDVKMLKAWIEESLENKYSKEFQDLVTAIGRFLGFKVEFGSYASTAGKIAYDGLWVTDEGVHIILEIKMGSWIVHDINQLGGYLESFSKENNLPEGKVFGLYILGDDSYIGEVDRIIDPKDPTSPVEQPEEYGYDPSEGKKLIVLKGGTLRKLIDPLKLVNAFPPMGPRYTTLREIAKARTLDDILS